MTFANKKETLPPGSFGFPLLGETLSLINDPKFLEKRQKLYGPIFKTKIFDRPTVVMVGYEANQFIFSSHADHFSTEGWPDNFKALFGKQALIFQEGEEHRRSRKLLMPTLHGSALANYLATIEQISLTYLRAWEQMESVTWFPELRKMTIEIASQLLLGSKSQEDNERLCQWFLEITAGLLSLPISWSWTPFGRALQARQQTLASIEQAMDLRRKSPTKDVLGMLMQTKDENGKGLSDDEIKSQAFSLFIGTIANTASMLTSLCMALAQHPDILAKVKDEQQQIVNESALTLENLKQMVYLDRVLKEVERCYPPIPSGYRRVLKPFVFKDYYIPQGWNVMYSIIGTHKDSRIYSEPEQFDPDRFAPEQISNKTVDYSLVGFGGGTHSCIGIAFAKTLIKVFASHLLRKYNWELLPNQNLTFKVIPILHPHSGLKVKIYKV